MRRDRRTEAENAVGKRVPDAARRKKGRRRSAERILEVRGWCFRTAISRTTNVAPFAELALSHVIQRVICGLLERGRSIRAASYPAGTTAP